MMSYFLVQGEEHGRMVLERYQRLRSQRLLCDVELVCGDGGRFHVHRSLLACCSDFFCCMFQEHTCESRSRQVELPALSSQGLRHVLDFIYTSWLPLCPATLEDTLETLSYLQVRDALHLCSRYMKDNLSVDTCCFFANVSVRYGVGEARSAAGSFIGRHMAALLGPWGDRQGLLDLNQDSLLDALGVEEMPGLEELQLLLLLLDWLGRNPVPAVRSNLLLSKVRFGLIPAGTLRRLASVHPALRTPFISSLTLKAERYHLQGPRQPLLQTVQTSVRSCTAHVLLVGGGPDPSQAARDVYAFNPTAKSFGLLTELPQSLRYHCACALGNFLFVLGGETCGGSLADGTGASSGMWRYDPRFRRWEAAPPMSHRRARFACCVLPPGLIVAAGGRDSADSSLASVEAYDVRTDRWERAAPLPDGMYGHAGVVYRGGILISGGFHGDERSSSRDVYALDTCRQRWTKRASMSIGRFGHHMAAVGEKVYAFLGMYEPFCDIECYQPSLNQWTRLKPLLSDRFCYGLAQLQDSVLLIGGRKWRHTREVPTPNVLQYEPGSDSWKEVCKLPRAMSGMQCPLLEITDAPEV